MIEWIDVNYNSITKYDDECTMTDTNSKGKVSLNLRHVLLIDETKKIIILSNNIMYYYDNYTYIKKPKEAETNE